MRWITGAAALIAACSPFGAADETVEIPVRPGYDFASLQPGGAEEVVTGRLYLPQGAPLAAAILSHGAGGAGARQAEAAEMLAENGIAALVMDHFGPRGIRSVARDQLRAPEQTMIADLFAARRVLTARLGLAPEQIGVVGWSKGATAVTLAAVERLAGFAAPGEAPFAFAAAHYPFCGFDLDGERLASPLLLLLAEKDDWTPSAPCLRQAEAWRGSGEPVEARLYEGARHGFDSTAGFFEAKSAITVRDASPRCLLLVDEDGVTRTADGAQRLDAIEGRAAFLEACGVRGVTFEGNEAARADAGARLLAFIKAAI